MSSDWPVMTSSVLTKSNLSTTKPELSNIVILPQDNLQTVLEKLGLGNYYHVFKVCLLLSVDMILYACSEISLLLTPLRQFH